MTVITETTAAGAQAPGAGELIVRERFAARKSVPARSSQSAALRVAASSPGGL